MSELKEMFFWQNSVKKKIEEEKDKINRKDYRFYKVDELSTIAEIIDKHSKKCNDCEKLKKDIDNLSKNLANYINTSVSSRNQYEKKLNNILKHLKTNHGIYSKRYFQSYYSFIGLFIGIVIGTGLSYILGMEKFKSIFPISFATGLIIGRILGVKKDYHNESKNLTI